MVDFQGCGFSLGLGWVEIVGFGGMVGERFEKVVERRKSLDQRRVSRMMLLGFGLVGPCLHTWFGLSKHEGTFVSEMELFFFQETLKEL